MARAKKAQKARLSHLQVNAKNSAIGTSIGDDLVASKRASEYFKAPEL